jgi:hypothetical protein
MADTPDQSKANEQANQSRKESVDKQLQVDKEASERSREQAKELLGKGKPTPTQEDNDRAKLGEFVLEKEDDGSGPDTVHEKNLEVQRGQAGGARPTAGAGGSYGTRDMSAGGTPNKPAGGAPSSPAPRGSTTRSGGSSSE